MNALYSEDGKKSNIKEIDKTYFIINIEKDTVYGPFSREKFDEMFQKEKLAKELFIEKKQM